MGSEKTIGLSYLINQFIFPWNLGKDLVPCNLPISPDYAQYIYTIRINADCLPKRGKNAQRKWEWWQWVKSDHPHSGAARQGGGMKN